MKYMVTILTKSTLITLCSLIVFIVIRTVFHTDTMIADIGVLGLFGSFFGVLFGILSAFVVFEVWGQYNKTVALIEKEAMNLEKIFRLAFYFRDKKFLTNMENVVNRYITMVCEQEFPALSQGSRVSPAGKIFREISQLICSVKFDDNHDQVVFDHMLAEYNTLAEVRSERLVQSLARLPNLLRIFLYMSSFLATSVLLVAPVIIVPFGLLCTGGFVFILSLVLQLVEDLDNPFVGYWNINVEPYKRAQKHIKEDYTF